MATKKGPLSREELMAIWSSAVDTAYREPLEEAGDGAGLEVYSQAAEVFARVSKAIDVNTQALYILPHSGQSDEPANGDVKATVTLSIARTKLLEKTLVLTKGTFLVEEATTDATDAGGVDVLTGRQYILTEDLVIPAGEMGPYDVEAIAEGPGYGYNNPLPGTLKSPVQTGAFFTNDLATVVAADTVGATQALPAKAQIKSENEADTFVPEHVGQYVVFLAGANLGKVGRIVHFAAPPDPVAGVGSIVDVSLDYTVSASTFAGTFEVGELLTLPSGTGQVIGVHDHASVRKLVYRLLVGTAAIIGDVVTGQASGATLTVNACFDEGLYVAETDAAEWRVLGWAFDWGLAVTNEASPSGGKIGVLDEIGYERGLARASGEPDARYRQRVSTLADVVSPNALKRAMSRTLGALPWKLREVSRVELPGFYFDEDAYDYDVVTVTGTTVGTFLFNEEVVLEDPTFHSYVRGRAGDTASPMRIIRRDGKVPSGVMGLRLRGLSSGARIESLSAVTLSASTSNKRFNVWLDYVQFRAFFLAEVPRLALGEYGFAYDAPGRFPYDLGAGAYDGAPINNSPLYRAVYQALDEAHAGGVSFDLIQAAEDETFDITTPALLAENGDDLLAENGDVLQTE